MSFSRHLSESNKRFVIWIGIALIYFLAQVLLYSQDQEKANKSEETTPWEHLSLEGALVIAVGVQYRENRAKEAAAVKVAADMGAALAKNSEVMEQMVEAMERLSGRVEQCPGRGKG